MSTSIMKPSGGILIPRPLQLQTPIKRKKGVILIGTPCTGKTVISKLLVSQYGAKHYSSSSALHAFAKKHHRPEIIAQMKAGDLVQDMEVIKLVSGWDFQDFTTHVSEDGTGVFDGWGRAKTDLEFTLERLKGQGEIHVLFLDATDDCLLYRAERRGRNDDVAIQKRISNFRVNFEDLRSVSEKRLGRQYCHIIDTTPFSEKQVLQQACARLGLN